MALAEAKDWKDEAEEKRAKNEAVLAQRRTESEALIAEKNATAAAPASIED